MTPGTRALFSIAPWALIRKTTKYKKTSNLSSEHRQYEPAVNLSLFCICRPTSRSAGKGPDAALRKVQDGTLRAW